MVEFGRFRLDAHRRELLADGLPVPIGSRAFDTLIALVEAGGRLVTKDELLRSVWSGTVVEEHNLQFQISTLRKALGPDRDFIKTISGRGYRFVADIIDPAAPEEAPSGVNTALLARRPERFPLTNLPAPMSELVGLDAAVQQVQDLLTERRAVTLTGPGGIGKTTLALEAARRMFPAFRGDVWLVELASLSDPDLVPSSVARAIGLKLASGEISSEAAARAIGERKLLLVLDNCEHVIDAAASLAEAVVRLCPAASVLATSREILRIEGEYIFQVPPLNVPPSHQDGPDLVLRHSAVQLFVARAQALRLDFSPNDESLSAIAAICRHLDGIPLAIEFAAARAAAVGVQQVASGLEDRFRLLTAGRRPALPRHQTLRATLDWSYDLLFEAERRLLRRLAIFPSGFTLDAATAIMHDIADAVSSVVVGIANLVAKSLVVLDGSAPVGRWRLLETVRVYALEKLVQSGEAQQTARRHAEFYRDAFAPAVSGSPSHPSIEDLVRYGRELDNVRAALDWSFSPDGDAAIGVALTAAFAPVWLHMSLIVECRERAEQTLDVLRPDFDLSAALEQRLYMALGVAFTLTLGPVGRTRAVIAKARQLAEGIDDVEVQLRMIWAQWYMETIVGEYRAALITAREYTALAPRTGDYAMVLAGDRFIGTALFYVGGPREARDHLQRMVDCYVAPPDGHHTILFHFDQRLIARAQLARVLCLQGYAERAAEHARLAFKEAQASDGFTLCWVLQNGLYPVALMTGEIGAAEEAVAIVNDLAIQLDAALWKIVGSCLEGKLHLERGEFAESTTLLSKSLDLCERTGWQVNNAVFLGDLALGLAGLGRLDEALATIGRALARAENSGERWYDAELFRIKGEMLLQKGSDEAAAAAEDCFGWAGEVAREQGALFWELQVALSLARSRVTKDRHDEARHILTPVYNRFTEGFGTPNLRAAKALLDSLPSSRMRGRS